MPQEKVSQIMEEIRGPAGRTNVGQSSRTVNETVLANYLKNEYPQTVSVVLSKIKPEHAARVLGALPEEFALEVVQRMLRMESVQKDILDKVEKDLARSSSCRTSRAPPSADSHEHMAEIFNNFDRQTESRFITLARGTLARQRRAHQGVDVHLRGSGQARSGLDPDACCAMWRRTSSASRSRARPTLCATSSSPT